MERLKKKVSLICCFILTAVFLCPTNAMASAAGAYELEQNVEIIMQYITVDEEGRVTFDAEQAMLNQETDEIIQAGYEAEKIAEIYYRYNHGTSMQRMEIDITVPYHGNWCGPGYGSGMPVDYLDRACQWHDFCYQDFGYWNCVCDQGFIDRIDRDYHLMGAIEQQKAMGAVTAFSALMVAHGCY